MASHTPLVKWLIERGEKLWQCHQWEAAEVCWQQVLRFAPVGSKEWQLAQVRLVYLAQRRGDFAEAKQHARQLLIAQPLRARWHFLLGRCYRKQRPSSWKRALRHLRQAVRLAPNKARYWSELGRCLADCGYPEKALRCLYRAWHLEPDALRHLVWLVELLLACDRFGEAQRIVQQARFCHRGNASWAALASRLGYLQVQRRQGRSRLGETYPVFLPFPASTRSSQSQEANCHLTKDAHLDIGSSSDPRDVPRIIRLDPGHQLAPRLRLRS